jgi:hypothetical protein
MIENKWSTGLVMRLLEVTHRSRRHSGFTGIYTCKTLCQGIWDIATKQKEEVSNRIGGRGSTGGIDLYLLEVNLTNLNISVQHLLIHKRHSNTILLF